MIFTLEALEAKHGDALLLYIGDAQKPKVVLIDAGPDTVYANSVKPRLLALKQKLAANEERLTLHAVMVSHVDDDHINGVIDLVKDIKTNQQKGTPEKAPFRIQQAWHNGFDILLPGGGGGGANVSAVEAAVGANLPPGTTAEAAAVVASIGQGRQLREALEGMAVPMNQPFGDLVAATGDTPGKANWPDGVELTVLGPNRERVAALRKKWAEHVADKPNMAPVEWQTLAAAYLDESVANLSSIVVLVKSGGKSMLLTGDARGDDILSALERFPGFGGKLHVDLLKVPHHGSDRNVATNFFRRVTADHYVISADGTHGNPDVATAVMIAEARGNAAYTVHLTNAVEPFMSKIPAAKLKVAAGKSVVVNLGDALAL